LSCRRSSRKRPEPGESFLISETEKWIRGIRWEEIDEHFVLRHATSREGKTIEVNLMATAPRVMAELDRYDMLPKSGPIIVSEVTKRPHTYSPFRDHWRKIAEAAGLSTDVRIMGAR
jgi:hypothetical protein